MRARQRHFNARDCDAALCLDARFITGLSDGNAVSTWSDRSRNAADAVQSNATNQPEYKEAIQGGQPVVRFNGTDDFFPMTTPLADVFRNKGYGITIATAQDRTPTTGRTQHFIFSASTNASGFLRSGLTTRNGGVNQFRAGGRRLDADTLSAAILSPSDSNWHIFAAENDWTNNINRLRVEFTSRATSTYSSSGGLTSNTASANVEIGSSSNSQDVNAAPIDLGQLFVLNIATTESLVKRLHHAAAFSFKIACN
jgi:hypothetical protein